jgi:hypothetical protein
MASLKKNDIVVEHIGAPDMIRLARNSHEKNHAEVNEDFDNGGRIASVPGNRKCPVKVITNYLEKLNPLCDSLWQRPKKNVSAESSPWYDNAPLGHNTLKTMMKSISVFSNLSSTYTNHCLRVSSCSLLGEAGFSDLDIAAVSKHKSLSSLGIYKRVRDVRKSEMSQTLSIAMGITSNDDALLEQQSDSPEDPLCTSAMETSALSNQMAPPNHSSHNKCCLSIGAQMPPIIQSPCSDNNEIADYIGLTDTDLQNFMAEYENENKINQEKNVIKQAVKKGNKIVILNNCTGTFNF